MHVVLNCLIGSIGVGNSTYSAVVIDQVAAKQTLGVLLLIPWCC